MGLDVDENALPFAVSAIAPSSNRFELGLRWEELEAQVWKGGLQTVNEAFVGVECIICTEVVEHLEPEALQAVGPILLGIYHPQYLLITTPSYDFNPRFTPPNVANRHGYTDPTKRTNRIFRHGDHKFEWTREEFKQWCQKEAETWGYSVEVGTLGRPQQVDPWGRDNELGGASSWALFRCESMRGREQEMEKKAREVLAQIKVEGKAHELLASHRHPSHEAARKPKSLEEIGQCVKKVMEDCRESFMLVEFLWFTPEVATACGGWIELLIKAIEETDGIILKKDEGGGDTGFSRENWAVGLVGGLGKPRNLWSQDEDQVPPDWTPGEGDSDSADETEWGGSTGVEGDVSLDGSEVEDDEEDGSVAEKRAWRAQNWNKKLLEEEGIGEWGTSGPEWSAKWGEYEREERIYSSAPSTAGWDGDASDDTTS
ncbi:hypothetical protein AX16_003256 [Volvariella volvacea WC 439]|nr:hypothetical protein AX16_003256 [Volvariella volvacea WC 439]